MAIHTTESRDNTGFVKKINAGAMGMIMDNLQRQQYNYPVESTARELFSNANDSINEKFNAIKILRGEAKVEDFYAVLTDDELSEEHADSKFDPDYYNLDYLDLESEKALILYEVGGNTGKDLLRVIDKGVGLGGKRLQGYMELGYSTKRLNKTQLGKFGIGAKAGLSTGVKYYTTISIYNGRKYKFNIYNDTVDSIIPQFDLKTGVENEHEIWKEQLKDGTFKDRPVYYEKTDEKNGVEVQLEFKKHYKAKLISAVQNQLLYFPRVDFKVIEEDGRVVDIPVLANILYEDDDIILSDNNQFSKPHIIINNVAYGAVDFLELELEQKQGNIGLKVQAESVDITPSRESVIWNDVTRDTIITKFKLVVDTASKLVEARLQETDFLQWLRTCISTLNGSITETSSDPQMEIIRRLARVVDTASLKPTYPLDKSIKYFATASSFLKGVEARLVKGSKVYRGSKTLTKVERDKIKSMTDFGTKPVFMQTGNSSKLKDKYLLSLYPDGFVSIKVPIEGEEPEEGEEVVQADQLKLQIDEVMKEEEGDDAAKLTKWKVQTDKLLELFKGSKDIQNYNDIKVPKDFEDLDKQNEEEEAEIDAQDQFKNMTPAEKRKVKGQVVATTPSFRNSPGRQLYDSKLGSYINDSDYSPFLWSKVEPYLSDIDTMLDAELYYATSATNEEGEKEEENLLMFAAAITRKVDSYSQNRVKSSNILPEDGYYPDDVLYSTQDGRRHLREPYSNQPNTHWFGTPTVRLIKVASKNVKHFRKTHNHIHQFFLRVDKTLITMSQALIKWNTARQIHMFIDRLKFLTNYATFNPVVAQQYKELLEYYSENYRSIEDYQGSRGFAQEQVESLLAHADKVLDLQLFVRANPDNHELIADKAKELFKTEAGQITDGLAVDLDIFDKLRELLDYSEPVYYLLNSVKVLTEKDGDITTELEQELRFYILQKRGSL